jgi:hypothetical protein
MPSSEHEMPLQVHRVVNLKTGEEVAFVGVTCSESVIAAHAQSIGDYNTWDYHQKYQADFGQVFVTCGDWSTRI